MRIPYHDACNAGIRPEGLVVNRLTKSECRNGCLGKSGMRIPYHDACNAGIRPEGPPVNRPGRQAGIGEMNKMSAEGAAQVYLGK